jgi:Zn-dependent M28 family amino/carboxypeptidase
LFNGEEIGLLGSSAYSEDLNDLGTERITAMLQMDMIGYRTTAVPQRRIEIHPPGSTDFTSVWPQILTRSQALATAIGTVAAVVSPQLEVQIYPLPPCTTDPVAWRSDHTAFLVGQMTACAVAEELFGDSCATPGAHPHPGYHTINDTKTIIDTAYLADIARAVAAAAWVIANG